MVEVVVSRHVTIKTTLFMFNLACSSKSYTVARRGGRGTALHRGPNGRWRGRWRGQEVGCGW